MSELDIADTLWDALMAADKLEGAWSVGAADSPWGAIYAALLVVLETIEPDWGGLWRELVIECGERPSVVLARVDFDKGVGF